MKTHTWTDEEREEYESICAEARDGGRTVTQQVDRFIELIQSAEGSNAMWVRDVVREIWRAGASSIFKKWLRQQSKPIAVSHDGHLMTKPRIVGRKTRSDSGKTHFEQTLFDYLSWDQLREKVGEYKAQIRAYTVNVHMAERLLDLEEAAPGASNPAEALDRLGMSMQEWFDAEAEAS